MKLQVRRLAFLGAVWVLLWGMLLAAAVPASGETLAEFPEITIHIRKAVAKKNQGILSVTVEYTLDWVCDPGDMLWITASCGGQSTAFPLKNSEEEVRCVIFSGCEEPDRVKMQIRGFRRGEDGRLIPVHAEAEATVDGERIVTFVLSPGGSCDLYLVGELWELLNGYLVLNPIPNGEEFAKYGVTGNFLVTLVAADTGEIQWNFTENGYPDGVYLMVERETGIGRYVTVPQVNPQGDLISCHVFISTE